MTLAKFLDETENAIDVLEHMAAMDRRRRKHHSKGKVYVQSYMVPGYERNAPSVGKKQKPARKRGKIIQFPARKVA